MERSIDLPAPTFEHLFRVEFDREAPICVGNTPDGQMNVIPFHSGTFEGSKLRGTVIAGGGDWNIRRSDGVSRIDGKYILKTDDGCVISIEAKGAAILTDEQVSAIQPGHFISPEEYYFRERLFFTVGAKKYKWLNDVIVVATGGIDKSGKVCLDAYVLR